MKKRRYALVLLPILLTLTACGEGTTDIQGETLPEPATESVTVEESKTLETEEPIAADPVYTVMEALAEAEGILSVETVDHSTPGIDIAALPEGAAEQYRAILEDYTTWEIRYTVASREVTAYAAAPNTYADTNPSLILYARGGNGSFGAATPQGAVSTAFMSGSVVLFPDYGEDDEFGGSDVDNVTFWLDVIPTLGFVDPDEVWLLGESRGGMEGCLTLLRDDAHVIKAAALVSGIYDLPAVWESRPDMREMLTRRIGGTPEDCPEAYAERSAVNFAEKIDTPILLIHSTGDKQAPYAGAEDFAEALAAHGKSYELVTREDESHGLSAREMADVLAWLRANG